MRSLKDKVDRFLRKNNNQDDIRELAKAAREVAEDARDFLHDHPHNEELRPFLERIVSAADKTSRAQSHKFVLSEWVKDVRESMQAIEDLVREEKKELV